MYKLYLTENDMLKPNHFPAVAIINAGCNHNIEVFFKNVCHGIGVGFDYGSCSFWEDLDEFDRKDMQHFDGVLFEGQSDTPVVISFKELLYYLTTAKERFCANHSESLKQLDAFIEDYKSIYHEQLS